MISRESSEKTFIPKYNNVRRTGMCTKKKAAVEGEFEIVVKVESL